MYNRINNSIVEYLYSSFHVIYMIFSLDKYLNYNFYKCNEIRILKKKLDFFLYDGKGS